MLTNFKDEFKANSYNQSRDIAYMHQDRVQLGVLTKYNEWDEWNHKQVKWDRCCYKSGVVRMVFKNVTDLHNR